MVGYVVRRWVLSVGPPLPPFSLWLCRCLWQLYAYSPKPYRHLRNVVREPNSRILPLPFNLNTTPSPEFNVSPFLTIAHKSPLTLAFTPIDTDTDTPDLNFTLNINFQPPNDSPRLRGRSTN